MAKETGKIKKILFISHDASRTGAPMLLLSFLKWLKINTKVEFDIILLAGGELESEFLKLSSIYYWEAPLPKIPNIFLRLYRKITKHYPDYQIEYKNNLIEKFKKSGFNLIYANTVITTPIVNELHVCFGLPVIVHIHELYGITRNFKNSIKNLAEKPSTTFLVVSEKTKHNLLLNHNIPSNKIELIYAYIDIKKWTGINYTSTFKNNFIVSSSGLVQIRKGTDFFILIANRAIKKYPEIPWIFNWIGEIDNSSRYYYETDLKKLNLEKKVFFIGSVYNTIEYYVNTNVFLMISREDPFPLVCLEHAALGKPIVCFDEGSGISEFIKKGTGIVVKYMDIEAVVDALAILYKDPDMYLKFSDKAKKEVRKFDIEIQSKKILSIIENA